jgi:hypothetical protein
MSRDKVRNLFEAMERLQPLAIWSPFSGDALQCPSITAGFEGLGEIGLSGRQAMDDLATAVDLLHELTKKAALHAKSHMQDEILKCLLGCHVDGTLVNLRDCEALISHVRSLPAKQYRVIQRVYGGDLTQSNEPLQLGCYKVFSTTKHQVQLKAACYGENSPALIQEEGVVVSCDVVAADEKMAFAAADESFRVMESLVALSFPVRREHRRISIASEHAEYWRPTVAFADNAVVQNFHKIGPVELLPLDDKVLVMPEPAMERLWALTANDKPSAWEKTLLKSARWLGDAFLADTPSAAAVKAATALECLLYQHVGPCPPSKVSVLSESAARIIGGGVARCLEVENDIRDLYSRRSAAVHSGDGTMEPSRVAYLVMLARTVLFRVLHGTEWSQVRSAEDFRGRMANARYVE